MAKQPADAAADAIDAVRAVADVSVQAIRRRRTDAVIEMNVLTNYCVAAFRDEPRVLPIKFFLVSWCYGRRFEGARCHL